MIFLQFGLRVSEDSFTPGVRLRGLRYGETVVHHHLIVLYQIHFSLVFLIKVILTLAVCVTLLHHCRCARFVSSSETVLPLVVLAQVVVESSVSMGWEILRAQATGVV